MSVKLSVTMLVSAIFEAYERGRTQGGRDLENRVYESTRALVSENSQLKTEISSLESRLMAKDQKDSFSAVRAEQKRIAKGIMYYTLISPEQRQSLLESLVLAGFVGDTK